MLNNKLTKFFSWALIFIPPIFMVLFCLQYGLNFPYGDQWDTPGSLFFKLSQNQPIVWSDWVGQHNESRKLFPRLVFVGLAKLTDWNIKVEYLFNCFLNTVNLITLYWLGKNTLKDDKTLRICLILSSLLLFSLVQYDNYLWGIQICVFLSITTFILCLGVFQENLSLVVKVIVGGILCTVSTFSFANGILSWVLVIPALIISERLSIVELRKRLPCLLLWLGLMGTNLLIYFYDYVKPGNHPSYSVAIEKPFTAIRYYLIFLGNPLGNFHKGQALIVGAVILSLWFLCLTMIGYRALRDQQIVPQTKGWILMGGYSLTSALITTLGRVGFGAGQALASRYTSFSVWLYISLIFLAAIVLQECRLRFFYSPIFKGFIGGLIGLGLILHISTSQKSFTKYSQWRFYRLQGQACVVLSHVIEDADCVKMLYPPGRKYLENKLTPLNNLGYLHPPLIKTREIESFANFHQTQESVGNFDKLFPVSETAYEIFGWARFSERHEPADAILLTYQGQKAPPKIFHRVQRVIPRDDIRALFKKRPSFWLWGWEGEFEKSQLPPGEWTIKAWAFNTIEGKAFELPGQFSLIVN